MESFAAPEVGGAGGSGVCEVAYVRFVFGRRRRQMNGCLEIATGILAVVAVVVFGNMGSFWMSKVESR